ncbi:hypothetical protein FHR92_001826 [Fontibacillus solani]|uniref:Uncharacterized protein n=1 Tax=Fontibacillus solani TaxID=1572857 RepID=A0A7W3SSG2_9BACL|nr:hypothetical protein [Fontibacillus solani]MBA9085360.1 hypothetical protein [Fontibacillus solani]
MKQKMMLLQTIIITLSAVVLLMLISKLEGIQPYWNSSHTVFAEQKPIQLSDDNLVNEFIQLDLPVRLSKVEINGSILSVDLKVTENELSKANMYMGMAEIISFTFKRTTNIDQLLLRLVAEDRWVGGKYLLLAADVRRGSWPSSALTELKNTGDNDLAPELKSWFRVTESRLWKKRLQTNNEINGNITLE